jgi:hypothetical protein
MPGVFCSRSHNNPDAGQAHDIVRTLIQKPVTSVIINFISGTRSPFSDW